MKVIKRFGILSLLMILIMSMCVGCKIEKEDVVGAWIATGYYDGSYYTQGLMLTDNNIYIATVSKDNGKPTTKTGEYEIIDNEVRCYLPDTYVYHGGWTSYKYKKGKLINGVWTYSKFNE